MEKIGVLFGKQRASASEIGRQLGNAVEPVELLDPIGVVVIAVEMEDLIDWLVTDYGMTPQRAYLHTCLNPEVRVNVYQYTLGLATIGAQIPVACVE